MPIPRSHNPVVLPLFPEDEAGGNIRRGYDRVGLGLGLSVGQYWNLGGGYGGTKGNPMFVCSRPAWGGNLGPASPPIIHLRYQLSSRLPAKGSIRLERVSWGPEKWGNEETVEDGCGDLATHASNSARQRIKLNRTTQGRGRRPCYSDEAHKADRRVG
jgi:hypothetical protein